MRIVTVFTVFVIIIYCAPSVFAQENKAYSFSLSPQFGLVYGRAEEIVYPTNTKAPLLSQLLWDMKPVFYYGLLMELSSGKPMERQGFFSGLSLKFGIPGTSGVMEDRDWQSIENEELTNYSHHDNITKEFFLLDFSAGYSFPFFNVLLVKPFINISYMNLRFKGENGWATYARELTPGKYAPIDDNPDKESFSGRGTLISYSQEWFYAAPGVSVLFGYKGFLAEVSFMITPLVFCADLDEHKLRNTQYIEKMFGGIMLEPGFRFSFTWAKWLGVSWEISWRYISGARGLSYKSPIGAGAYVQMGEAGAGLSMLNTALLFKVKLGAGE
jgi:outer membrane protease